MGLVALVALVVGVAWYLNTTSTDTETTATAAAAEPGDNNTTDTDDTGVSPTTTTTEVEAAASAPPDLGPVFPVTDLDGWMNTDNTSFDDWSGTVRIVQFWTFGCYNCKNTLPHLQELYASYDRSELEIIGLHSPEFDWEGDPDNIAEALVDLDVTWPVGLDTNKTNFRSWQGGSRRFWPRTYVIDQNDRIRFDHIGEGAYDELAATVDWLVTNGP